MEGRTGKQSRRERYYRAVQQRALAKAEVRAARIDGIDVEPYLRDLAHAEAAVERYEKRHSRWWPF
jgi:hypothetical protein